MGGGNNANLLNVAIKREQSQTCLSSAECEQVQGRNALNVTKSNVTKSRKQIIHYSLLPYSNASCRSSQSSGHDTSER